MEKRAFGIADDMYVERFRFLFQLNLVTYFYFCFFVFVALDRYEAGLLFAYLSFIPFCAAGVMDSLSLRVSHTCILVCLIVMRSTHLFLINYVCYHKRF